MLSLLFRAACRVLYPGARFKRREATAVDVAASGDGRRWCGAGYSLLTLPTIGRDKHRNQASDQSIDFPLFASSDFGMGPSRFAAYRLSENGYSFGSVLLSTLQLL